MASFLNKLHDYRKVTESQIDRGWKGPSEITESSPSAKAKQQQPKMFKQNVNPIAGQNEILFKIPRK